jgi:hypothetical protein
LNFSFLQPALDGLQKADCKGKVGVVHLASGDIKQQKNRTETLAAL